jgi:hypothetical protein
MIGQRRSYTNSMSLLAKVVLHLVQDLTKLGDSGFPLP